MSSGRRRIGKWPKPRWWSVIKGEECGGRQATGLRAMSSLNMRQSSQTSSRFSYLE